MSEHLHPEVHPDADSLSAFVEGVLPEHERAECLAHLAECSRCREIVFLTPVPTPVHRRKFQPMPFLAAAAVVCVALLGAWLYLRSRTTAPPRELVARTTPVPSIPEKPVETIVPKPVERQAVPLAPRRRQPEPAAEKPSPATVPSTKTAPTTAPPSVAESVSVSATPVNPPLPSAPPTIVVQTERAAPEASSGISGTVTDATGAVVPRADVQLRQLAGNRTTNARSDQAGQFKFTGLDAGLYELQITSPGFRAFVQRLEVKPQEVAAVKSQLQVGSTTETVEVNAAPSTLHTESASLSNGSRRSKTTPEPRLLPSKLPTEIRVTRGKVMLSVDSSGTLFFSGNSGKSWKAVKPQWTGKIDDLVTPPDLPQAGPAQFQLTTDSGAEWLSRDGRRWYPSPPQH